MNARLSLQPLDGGKDFFFFLWKRNFRIISVCCRGTHYGDVLIVNAVAEGNQNIDRFKTFSCLNCDEYSSTANVSLQF